MYLLRNDFIEIQYTGSEAEAVQIALTNLKSDLLKVLNARIFLHDIHEEGGRAVYGVQNGPFAISDQVVEQQPALIKRIVAASRAHFAELFLSGSKVDTLLTEQAAGKKEAFAIVVDEGVLYLCGNDKRGTIYAVYEFCGMLGVSPWYFFADVPVRKRESMELKEGFCKVDAPSVEYRGIFINDEEELEKWATACMAERTIGPKTYACIFELLLRLKCNYIWPAMHVNSFNANVENGALAERMGIVVGTSHCDMLMRSNNREWEPWKKQKGYDDLVYDFSIEGENREKLLQYWRESVIQNKDFEVTYTLGMRGIHDSGFETKSLADLSGEELLQGKIRLLSDVLQAQDLILKEIPHKEALKLFVPYKEVLELYDNGLEVPEEYTLIWTNDNYGYLRRYPDAAERKRAGGNGVYYHQSYWAPPGGSYLFVCTTPAAQTRYELVKAYENGIQRLWVTNFGAIKPLEQQLSFYAALAWNVGKEDDPTADVAAFLADWIDQTFSGNHGGVLAPLLTRFDQVVNMRKLELMDNQAFYQSEYTDEACGRIHFLRDVFEQVNDVYRALPAQERDAFFEMILMRVHAAYYTNAMYYFADRSEILTASARDEQADECFRIAKKTDDARRALLYYYNYVLANGKWAGIVTPEDFPPPRTAIYPTGISRKAFYRLQGFCPDGEYRMPAVNEPDCRITREAEHYTESSGITVIAHLGRGLGNLVELDAVTGSVTYKIEIAQAGEYLLTVERYPSLNSVGEIRADFSLDGKRTGEICSDANDEHRGTWKRNVLDHVDMITAELGYLAEGTHCIRLYNATRYFAFSRIHVHNRKMAHNHFWHEAGVSRTLDNGTVPEAVNLDEIIGDYYQGAEPFERPELFLPRGYSKNSLGNEDICAVDEAQIFGSDCIKITVADALRRNGEADFFGAAPDYGIGIGRKKTGLFYRDQETLKKAGRSGVRYFFASQDAVYTLWVCLYTKGNMEYAFDVLLDGERHLITADEAKEIWRYSSENVYKWIPVTDFRLAAGRHSLEFTFHRSRLRLEGICLKPVNIYESEEKKQ